MMMMMMMMMMMTITHLRGHDDDDDDDDVVSLSPVFLPLLPSGVAEIFGTELAVKKEYHFTDCKLAAFSWYGATIEASSSQVREGGRRVVIAIPC